jgi:Domain of Unknown Function with PDB structure (DUF3857)/Transglutaminase-like superfamily
MPMAVRAWIPLIPALLLFLTPCAEAEDWLPVSPEDLQMHGEPKAPGAAAIYLYRQVDRDDTYPRESHYLRLKILTEEGRKYANVEIPFVKGTEYVRGISARTIRPDGTIARFDGTVYEKPLVSTRGMKLLAKTFTLPDVEVGSIIEYRYQHELQAGFVFDSHWILSQELFTRHAKFSLIPDRYFNLTWSWPRGMPEGTPAPAKERDRIRLESHDIPAFVEEEFMPPANELKYRVDFIYSNESVEKDPVVFWKHFGKQAFVKTQKFTDEPKAMRRVVEQVVQADDPPETKLRKLYERVQLVRNTTFESEKSEQEIERDKQRPAHSVEDVWNRGAGTASEVTYLFLALVRAAGLQADFALVSTRDKYFFSPAVENPEQLNSNLVIVALDGRDIFLDPGIPCTPFGMLPWNETAVRGLRLDKDGGTWVNTPLPDPGASRIERKAQLKMDERGTLSGKLTIRYIGLEAASRRFEERNEDETDRKQFLEDQLKATVPSGINVTLTNTPDWSNANEPLVVEYDLKIPGWASAAGQRQLVRVGLFASEDDRTFAHAMRTQPIYFDFPYEHADDVSIEMPPGRRIDSLPRGSAVDIARLSYKVTAGNEGGVLHLSRRISLGLLLLKVSYYDQLRQFFQSVRNGDEQQVVISP